MRFRMFYVPGKHHILAFANAKAKTFFWDMSRFLTYARFMDDLRESSSQDHNPPLPPPDKPSWLVVKKTNKKVDNVSSLRGNPGAGTGDKDSMISASPDPESTSGLGGYNQRTLAEWAEMYYMGNPHGLIKCHKQASVDGGFVGRQVAWSPEGEWCVVVGSANTAIIYHRWGKDTKGAAKDRKGSTPVPATTTAATNGEAAAAEPSDAAPTATEETPGSATLLAL